ncbi:MAG: nucleotidyl transferase AbiEii/AbiGii toxin family protein [Bacteroidales bacterium]|nr:nucleotidyl transferase AbiEii/AbiGii toxin family protein [Bacteroidales bacterium]
MKDFYDIYYLSDIFDFDGETLTAALQGTLQHRKRTLSENLFVEITDFKTNDFLNSLWRVFEPSKNSDLSFESVIQRLIDFIEPVYNSVLHNSTFDKKWNCSEKSWE